MTGVPRHEIWQGRNVGLLAKGASVWPPCRAFDDDGRLTTLGLPVMFRKHSKQKSSQLCLAVIILATAAILVLYAV